MLNPARFLRGSSGSCLYRSSPSAPARPTQQRWGSRSIGGVQTVLIRLDSTTPRPASHASTALITDSGTWNLCNVPLTRVNVTPWRFIVLRTWLCVVDLCLILTFASTSEIVASRIPTIASRMSVDWFPLISFMRSIRKKTRRHEICQSGFFGFVVCLSSGQIFIQSSGRRSRRVTCPFVATSIFGQK